MRRAVDPRVLPVACCLAVLASACVASGVLAMLAVGVLRIRQQLAADPVAPPPSAAHR